MVQYWLFKSEPSVYSIDDIKRENVTCWEGVRNYQARNFLRQCLVGDKVLFYHSNAKLPGVVGIVTVSKENYPDPMQFDINSKYYDSTSDVENPRWSVVDVKFEKKFEKIIGLDELKANSDLVDMKLVQRGNRLSVMPVNKKEFDAILLMSKN